MVEVISVTIRQHSIYEEVEETHGLSYKRHGKRVLDCTCVLLSMSVVLPVVTLLALVIFLMDGRSPFYSQYRVGKNGSAFRLWKLRSMVMDADAVLSSHLENNPDARIEWEKHQKLRQDPRITRVGLWIRKTSLDELPQLWNVLRGDMSLVGPRPIMVNQMSLYHCDAYYRLRPGLTGLWQVSSRNQISFSGRARFDRAYARQIGLKADIGIILRTVGVVLRGTGV